MLTIAYVSSFLGMMLLPIIAWVWLALLWHAFVDAVAVYAVQKAGILAVEGIVAIFALLNRWIVFRLRPMFSRAIISVPQQEIAAS